MSYLLKAGIGGALFLGSVVLFNVKLLDLMQTGTCASGGPYVSARQCPPGTGTDILLLIGSVLGGVIGAWVFALRGKRPGGSGRGGGTFSDGLLAWSVYFVGTGAYALYSVITDDSLAPDAQTGGYIVAGTFLLMGIPALIALIWLWAINRDKSPVDPRFQPSEIPTVRSTASGATDPGWTTMMQQGSRAIPMPTPAAAMAPDIEDEELDTLVKLERLQKLRESGALTDAEFEAQKKRVLND